MAKRSVHDQLVDGTLTYLASGATDVSVRALATASGRSTMCVYSHFGSRNALMGTVFDVALSRLLAALSAAGDDPSAAYTAWARAEPGLYHLIFDADLSAAGIDAERRRAALATVIETLSAGDTEEAAQLVWARTHGAAGYRRITGRDLPARE